MFNYSSKNRVFTKYVVFLSFNVVRPSTTLVYRK